MGLDCPDIRHWGLSSDIESFIQEIGHNGRDGMLSALLLLYGKGDKMHTSDLKQSYFNNDQHCGHTLLFRD